MLSHTFNFEGGEFLSKMGASWFVSYLYYKKIDKTHTNWTLVGTSTRIPVFNKTGNYHDYWLRKILEMDDNKLNTNKIKLSAPEIKNMAKNLLKLF